MLVHPGVTTDHLIAPIPTPVAVAVAIGRFCGVNKHEAARMTRRGDAADEGKYRGTNETIVRNFHQHAFISNL